jgi:hypothetical protein
MCLQCGIEFKKMAKYEGVADLGDCGCCIEERRFGNQFLKHGFGITLGVLFCFQWNRDPMSFEIVHVVSVDRNIFPFDWSKLSASDTFVWFSMWMVIFQLDSRGALCGCVLVGRSVFGLCSCAIAVIPQALRSKFGVCPIFLLLLLSLLLRPTTYVPWPPVCFREVSCNITHRNMDIIILCMFSGSVRVVVASFCRSGPYCWFLGLFGLSNSNGKFLCLNELEVSPLIILPLCGVYFKLRVADLLQLLSVISRYAQFRTHSTQLTNYRLKAGPLHNL